MWAANGEIIEGRWDAKKIIRMEEYSWSKYDECSQENKYFRYNLG